MRGNKGEWTEVYVFLKALGDGKFTIVNGYLRPINSCEVLELYKNNYANTSELAFLPNSSFGPIAEELLSDILEAKGTTFEIKNINNIAKEHDFSLFKADARSKSDLEGKIIDIKNRQSPRLGFSIKSFIASMPTLLNASSHTNFCYEVDGLNKEDVNAINSIKSRTKLKDRISRIKELGGNIYEAGAASASFASNLRRIDGELEMILSFLLLLSYESDKKDIRSLLGLLEATNPLGYHENELGFYKEKFLKFLLDTFKSFPHTSAQNPVQFGGLLVVLKGGELFLLDNIYFKDELKEFLLNNLKFDSPSSTRYKMLELAFDEQSGRAKFTLNMQIRFRGYKD